MSASNIYSPLSCEVKDGELVIKVGIKTLSLSAECSHGGPLPEGCSVVNYHEFAIDVARELLHEEEDGTTPIHTMFDHAMLAAYENGSAAVNP